LLCRWVDGQPAEPVLVSDKPARVGLWSIADSTTGTGVLTGGKDYCLGISWKVPLSTSNIVQTDSLIGDVKFTAVQSRHMDDFKCSDLYPTPTPTPTPTPPPQCQTNLDCNDGNECTDDLCNQAGQCQNPAVPDGIVCNAGTGTCLSGICQPQLQESCNGLDDDGNGLVDEGFPNTDGDAFADCVDIDDDNDGSIDPNDVSQWNPQICQDLDFDSCDDCSMNPTSSASLLPWQVYAPSTANDGPDSDSDGLCDPGDPTPQGEEEICDDGMDNDGNNFIDCADPACFNEPYCP
jgi:hypothetical protein